MNQAALEPNRKHALSRLRLLVLLVISTAALLAMAPDASAQFEPQPTGQDFCASRSGMNNDGPYVNEDPLDDIVIELQGFGIVNATMYRTNAEECLLTRPPSCPPHCRITVQTVCEYHCQHHHIAPYGWWVELRPTPQPGSSFLGFAANCEPIKDVARSSCVVKMDGDRPVTATFGAADTQPPTAPSATATPGLYSVNLNWSGSSDAWLAGYDIFRGDTHLARVRTTTYRAENLSCNTSYAFRVVAFDWSGNEASSAPVNTMTGRCVGPEGPPPDTVIHVKPPKSTRARQAFFHFGRRGTIPATKYQCKLDRGRWVACSGQAGKRYRNLRVGLHTFRVRAGNANGFDRSPAAYTWRVRRR